MELSQGARPLSHRNFHHIGFVVASIQDAAPGFLDALHAEWNGKIFHDPIQVVRVTFLRSNQAGNPPLELVEPSGENSPVIPLLKRSVGLHHLCYEIDGLEE